MKSHIFYLILATALILGIYFISTSADKPLAHEKFKATQVLGTHFPLTLIDPVGQPYILTSPPKRIVSTTLAGDEMLQQLNEVASVISVTYLVDNNTMSNVTGYYPKSIYRNHAGIEEILPLTPDLVISAPYTKATTVRLLLANHIPVFRFAPVNSFHNIDANLRHLAQVLGKTKRADQQIRKMWQQIRYIRCLTRRYPKPRVLFFPLPGFTAAKNTLADDMIRYAGGQNVADETTLSGNISITDEYAASLNPDILVLTNWFAKNSQKALEKLRKNPLWKTVPAVLNHRIYIVRAKTVSTVTPLAILAIKKLALAFHPALYNPKNVAICTPSTEISRLSDQTEPTS